MDEIKNYTDTGNIIMSIILKIKLVYIQKVLNKRLNLEEVEKNEESKMILKTKLILTSSEQKQLDNKLRENEMIEHTFTKELIFDKFLNTNDDIEISSTRGGFVYKKHLISRDDSNSNDDNEESKQILAPNSNEFKRTDSMFKKRKSSHDPKNLYNSYLRTDIKPDSFKETRFKRPVSRNNNPDQYF